MLLNKIIYSFPSRLEPFVYKLVKRYYSKARTVVYKDLKFTLYPTVFHPFIYLTTETLLNYVMSLDLTDKVILELGFGSGLISMQLAKNKGVEMHASDINAKAVEGLKENCKNLNIPISVYHSDLFSEIPLSKIDYLLINPPFFSNEVKSIDEYAFYTGEDYDYFHRLFEALKSDARTIANTLMILTNKCELDKIKSIASEYDVVFEIQFSVVKQSEEHFIYALK